MACSSGTGRTGLEQGCGRVYERVACVAGPATRRDIKPENFLLAAKDDLSHIKLTDFGLSTFFQEGVRRAAYQRPEGSPSNRYAGASKPTRVGPHLGGPVAEMQQLRRCVVLALAVPAGQVFNELLGSPYYIAPEVGDVLVVMLCVMLML
jgi:serine/threonine protein kinase